MEQVAQSKRQLAWVIDLNKCIGCQTCSVACKVLWPQEDHGTESMWWMTVNTQPGRGMPRDWETMGGGYRDGELQLGRAPTREEIGGGWDFNYDEVLRGNRRAGEVHLVAKDGDPRWGMNWDEDEGAGEYPNSYYYYMPRLCGHCSKPACVESCPHGAVFKREEDGIVLIDADRCRGHGACIRACPYKKIDFNHVRNVSQKCIGCFPRIDHGVAPACVRQCPGRAMFVGFLDDENSIVHQLVHEWKVAIPEHPEFGVESNVYYVPPLAPAPIRPDGSLNEAGRRIPREHLESKFGPRVIGALETLEAEIRKRHQGKPSQILDTLILYQWKNALGHLHRDPAEIDWTSEAKKPVSTDSMSGEWADGYRDKWKWDKVTWGTHSVDCYPGNCPFRVYVRDNKVVREEQGSTFPTIEKGVPDWNPTGCQKGAAWSRMINGEDRVIYPMRRAGERGEGRWTRVSWDEAATEIADAMLDAMAESGPRSILRPGTTEGGSQTIALANHIFLALGATVSDVLSEVGDMNIGQYVTFGRPGLCSSHDDWFHSELVLIWGNNPVQSNISSYHFISEARYNGSEVVTIAPDYSPSAVHADSFVHVRPGSDAALALSICQVVVEEGLVDESFVREQTDLGLLVRKDTSRFLRQSDTVESGSEEVFHFFDTHAQRIVEAPRTLDLGALEPALQGNYRAMLKDGTEVDVEPVFARLQRHLEAYRPEEASAICGVHPETIRRLARHAASKRTRILTGWTFCKSYHGDLIERALCLVLGLTGNWGKQGTGIRGIGAGMFDGLYIQSMKPQTGQQVTAQMMQAQDGAFQAARAKDPTLTRELFLALTGSEGTLRLGASTPFFFWYNQCGYRDVYNNPALRDPSMKRTFDEYVGEALEKGWWKGLEHPTADEPHRVLFNIGGNPLRMQRGGQRMLLKNLWPTLNMIVTMDFRLTTTALYSDFVLPVAQHHEKTNTDYPVHDTMFLALGDKAVEPQGESLSEYQITLVIARKLSERARERGMLEVEAAGGRRVRLDTFYDDMTLNGQLVDDDVIFDEALRDSAVIGTVPSDTTLATMREKGWVRYTDLGGGPTSLAQATDVRPDETFAPCRRQTEKKEPYPTLTRRAQFFIDHEWYLEAGESLPVHKEPPPMGGEHPFVLTSGHPRAGVNGMHSTDRTMMATTRGTPVAHINDGDAAARGIENGQDIRLFNDDSSMILQARVTPAVRPGQVVLYTGFESYLSPGWKDHASLETGMVKWLHLAGGYGHLNYRPLLWQPVPIDRGVRVDYEKVS